MAEINFPLKNEIKIKFRTQADFSEVVREHESLVSAVVNGRRKLPGEKKRYWARVLRQDVSYLFPDREKVAV